MQKTTAAKAAPDGAAALPRFMKLQQAVELFGRDEDGKPNVPESTIRYWVSSGKVSVFKPGKVLLFDREELIAFVHASRRGGLNKVA